MISSLGSKLGFWMPKEGKEAKGGRISSRRLLLVEERSFWSYGVGV
jgi:hypothetical protein